MASARSYLYVPADRAERIGKALAGDADAVVLDLEDAVADRDKDHARATAAATLRQAPPKPTWVRVNAIQSERGEDDVRAVASSHLAGIRLPKCESPDHVRAVADWLREGGATPAVQCLIESAVGLERIFELVTADSAVVSVGIGETDLCTDLGVADGAHVLEWARLRAVIASRAAAIEPPIQAVFTDLHDLAELERTTRQARAEGFAGRSAIHPRQVAIINAAFTPNAEEVRAAEELLGEAAERAEGAFTLRDGRFVDAAMVRRARQVLERAKAFAASRSA
jgi:citrate lyase subunit beta / citryl-CoA lyase